MVVEKVPGSPTLGRTGPSPSAFQKLPQIVFLKSGLWFVQHAMARGIFLIKFPHPYNSGHGALRDAFSCCKHSLNGDSISLLGAVQQHMGHSAYQLSVLQDWASTHPLDNSSGSGNQIRVLNGNYHISPIGASGRHADNFNIKFLHGVPLHIASYDRRLLENVLEFVIIL